MDEFASIDHWTADRQSADWQRRRGVIVGIGDDAAVVDIGSAAGLPEASGKLLLTVDMMVESIHFNEQTMRDEDVGYKAMAANVSDIAAMGGVPRYALAAVSVPASYSPERMRKVYDGLYACAERYGVAIVGGDTTSSPMHMAVSVTLAGEVEPGRELRRSGARAGDKVFVTGAVGMSAAGLHALQSGKASLLMSDSEEKISASGGEGAYAALVRAHCRPAPSVRAGRILLESGACRSLNDVSDGLASEAWEIAQASGLRLVLHERMLPKSGSLAAFASQAGVDPLEWMLYGGEDYVLMGTIDALAAERVPADFHKEGLPFYLIGDAEAGNPGVELLRDDNSEKREPLLKKGYNHFKR